MNKERLDKVQMLLDEMVSESYVAGINCLVLQQGKEVGYYEAGYRNKEEQVVLTRDTLFLLYSMSKPITAAAIMSLMEEGKIDLLDPASKYLEGFKSQQVVKEGKLTSVSREVTIKDLLDMTSGLVYGGTESIAEIETDKVFEEIKKKLFTNEALSTIEVANRLGRCPLKFEPGTRWQYGSSADILGAIIECASGRPLGVYLQERLFKPLGMNDTGFYVPSSKQHRLSKVYQEVEGQLVAYQDHNLGIMSDMSVAPRFESGGAGLVGTIDDYAKFAKMLLNNGNHEGAQILASETVRYMTHSHLAGVTQADFNWDSLRGHSYGNLMRLMMDSGEATFNGTNGEYGWDGWLGCYFANDPTHELTILMMQQRTDAGTTPYTRKLRNIVAAAL